MTLALSSDFLDIARAAPQAPPRCFRCGVRVDQRGQRWVDGAGGELCLPERVRIHDGSER